MLIVIILLGLLGFCVVVVIHELGHFAAARAMGVEVEAFSIGWGPKIASFKRGATEWRISAFPIGGYCKMKGEESFRKALEDKADELPRDKGSYYGVSPWRRIVISTAGPLANLLFAFLVFTIVSTMSYSFQTGSNRIVLASEFPMGSQSPAPYPADAAGLRSGDRILEVGGAKVADYSDLLERITPAARQGLALRIERDGAILERTITPMMDKDSGAGKIGVYSWTDPVVAGVTKDGAAQKAGLAKGDRILSIDGAPVRHSIEILALLGKAKPAKARIAVDRGGSVREFELALSWTAKGESDLGLSFPTITHSVRIATSPGAAIKAGFEETFSTFALTIKGIESLFQGVNILKALSGPARITYMVGQSATAGIQQYATGGLTVPIRFLAFLSLALFIMNLLPIPALDGGQVLMFAVEGLRRKSLRPLTIYRYQFIGVAFILAIFVVASVGDLLFFAAK
jgi:regulator of sigma E protease